MSAPPDHPDYPDLSALTQRLHQALPQTQCTRCGYPDCAAYAHAMAHDNAPINQCPPGGAQGVQRLAHITGRAVIPLNPEHGPEGVRHVAIIDESWCIGCTLCLKACPTDAIVGSNKHMHTVIEPWCTGCELCIPVCPVDCIELEPVGEETGWDAWSPEQAQTALHRYEFHSKRLAQEQAENTAKLDALAQAKLANLAQHSRIEDPEQLERKKSLIAASLERARALRQKRDPQDSSE